MTRITKKHEREKYPALEKAIADTAAFEALLRAFPAEELSQREDEFAASWKPYFLRDLRAEAERRLKQNTLQN